MSAPCSLYEDISEIDAQAGKWSRFYRIFLNAYNAENKLLEDEYKSIYKMFLVIQVCFLPYYLELDKTGKLIRKCFDILRWTFDNEEIFNFEVLLS